MKKVFLVVGLVVVVVLAGCSSSSGPELASSFADIEGAWQNANGSGPVFIYNADGSVQCGGSLAEAQVASGCETEAWFDGTEYHTVNPNFCDGAEGVYQIQLLDNGNLKYLLVEDDDCPDRVTFIVGDEGEVEHVNLLQ